MTINEKQFQFTKCAGSLLVYGTHILGLDMTMREVQRFPDRQQELYDKEVSDTLQSKHLDSLAMDIIIFRNGEPSYDDPAYNKLGAYWEQLGGIWGGRFRMRRGGADSGHFEWGPGMEV